MAVSTIRTEKSGRWVGGHVTPLGRGLEVLWTIVFAAFLVLVAIKVNVVFALLLVVLCVALYVALHHPELLQDAAWALAVVAFGIGIFATGHSHASIRFFEAVVQIVPVLFIALSVEILAFRSARPRHGEDLRPAAVTALALAYAEYEALAVLASGDAAHADIGLMVGALAAAGVGVVLPVVLGPRTGDPAVPSVATSSPEPETARERSTDGWRARPGLLLWLVILIASRRRR